MELARFRITGERALLTHNPAAMARADGKPKQKRIPAPAEEADAGVYRDSEGNFCLPAIAFRSALLEGLKGKKVGRTAAGTHFSASVFTVDELCVLVDPESGDPLTEYAIDTRRAVVQRNGILRSRPRFERWSCSLVLEIDTDRIAPEQVATELNEAGQIVGVGDYRLGRKGIFGKFRAELEK